jgi:small GTP-binding protein
MAHKIKLFTLGRQNVGKSSIICRYVDDNYIENLHSTLQIETKKKTVKLSNNQEVQIELNSTVGYELLWNIHLIKIKKMDGLIYVYDITDKESFNSLINKIQKVKDESDLLCRVIPSVLVGNKVDLDDNERKVTFEEGEKLAQENNINFYEISAKENINIKKCISYLVKEIMQNKLYDDRIEDSFTIEDDSKSGNDKRHEKNCFCG